MSITILAIGDIVGRPGRKILQERLPAWLQENHVDFCVANGENAARGAGLTPELAEDLFQTGVNVITNGDHVWRRKQIVTAMENDLRLLRPLNLSPRSPGSGYGTYKTSSGTIVGVLNLLGRTFMMPSDCPFSAADRALEELSGETRIIVVDIHAEATADKVAMGWYLDGRVSFVFGTHTHIPTADARVLPEGTAYITDLGMTGPYDSVIGRRKSRVLKALTTQVPHTYDVAAGDVRLCGALVQVDEDTGRAESIRPVCLKRESA